MWIDPQTRASSSVTEPAEDVVDNLQGFILNLGYFTNLGALTVDNLIVSNSPASIFPGEAVPDQDLVITSILFDPSQMKVEFTFNGVCGDTYFLEDCSDLKDWKEYFSFTATEDGKVSFPSRETGSENRGYFIRVRGE